ncbi:MAG: hypothetical protein R3F49_04105 [Planctomycetota bacterium]
MLDDRVEREALADLASLAAFPEVYIQAWVPARDVLQKDRIAQAALDDPRTLVFTQNNVARRQRLAHAAKVARGECLLVLPTGRSLNPDGLAELAQLAAHGGPRFVLAPGSAPRSASGIDPGATSAAPLAPRGRFSLAELLRHLDAGATVAVAPDALLELDALPRSADDASLWGAFSALEFAAYFLERSAGREWALGTPLLAEPAHSHAGGFAEQEARAAWKLQVLAALSFAVDHGDPSPNGVTYREARHERLGGALVEAVRTLSTIRNPKVLAGLPPAWAAPRVPVGGAW